MISRVKLVDWGDGYWVYLDDKMIGSDDQFDIHDVLNWFQGETEIFAPLIPWDGLEAQATFTEMKEKYS